MALAEKLAAGVLRVSGLSTGASAGRSPRMVLV